MIRNEAELHGIREDITYNPPQWESDPKIRTIDRVRPKVPILLPRHFLRYSFMGRQHHRIKLVLHPRIYQATGFLTADAV